MDPNAMIDPRTNQQLAQLQNAVQHRTLITLDSENKIRHNQAYCRVALRANKISIGCSDITPEAAKYIMKEWEKKFGHNEEEVILQ